MPLNYPADGRFDGLLGLNNSLSKMLRDAMPLQNMGISDSLASIAKMSNISQQLFPGQQWLTAMSPSIPDLAGLASLKNLSAFRDQVADLRSLSFPLSVSQQLAGQFNDWQQTQQQLTANFAALVGFQRATLSPWVLQAQGLQQLLAGLQVQLQGLAPEELEEQLTIDEPEVVEQADFSHLTQQLATFADTTTATAVTTAAEVAAMRSELRVLTALAQRQMDYIEQARMTEKSPWQIACRILNVICYIWTLISIVAFINDRMPKAPATTPPTTVQEPASTLSSRPATRQELLVLQVETNDSLFFLARRTNQVRTTTSRSQLRFKPRHKSTGRGRIGKNTAVVVQQTYGKWALVLAQRTGYPPLQGWMLRKHLSKSTHFVKE